MVSPSVHVDCVCVLVHLRNKLEVFGCNQYIGMSRMLQVSTDPHPLCHVPVLLTASIKGRFLFLFSDYSN